jgi:DNA replication initiation complex subunit (GINS family)
MPNPPPDYYNKLLEQRRQEYASKGLSKLPPEFLGATQAYLAWMREVLEQEIRENPTSRKVELTRVTYQRAVASARDVLEARLSKIAQLAATHANLGGDPSNLLPEERALYDSIMKELAAFRRTQAPFLEASASPAPASASSAVPSSRPPSTPPSPPAAPAPARPPAVQAAAPAVPATATPPPPPAVVRVLQDLPNLVLAKDETVDLFREDLLTLPPAKADVLVHGKRAERVDARPPTRST